MEGGGKKGGEMKVFLLGQSALHRFALRCVS